MRKDSCTIEEAKLANTKQSIDTIEKQIIVDNNLLLLGIMKDTKSHIETIIVYADYLIEACKGDFPDIIERLKLVQSSEDLSLIMDELNDLIDMRNLNLK